MVPKIFDVCLCNDNSITDYYRNEAHTIVLTDMPVTLGHDSKTNSGEQSDESR